MKKTRLKKIYIDKARYMDDGERKGGGTPNLSSDGMSLTAQIQRFSFFFFARKLTGVQHLMFHHVGLLRKGFITNRTFVWLET